MLAGQRPLGKGAQRFPAVCGLLFDGEIAVLVII